MASPETIQVAVVTALCFFIIVLRTVYRLTLRCNHHVRCHRKWHVDDLWMALSFLPLIGRAATIAWSSAQARDSKNPDLSDTARAHANMLSSKLLIPSRICYMLFLWCMKMCLLELYLRLAEGIPFYTKLGLGIRWSLYLTAVAILLSTVLECRPLELAWNGDPAGVTCRRGRANLITMAACNIATDLALILFPIMLLRRTGLEFMRFIRLAILFALGSLVIITTIIRLPLILRDDAQKIRSLWASIEITCACFIANAPFLQAVIVDAKLKGSHNTSLLSMTQTPVTRTRSKSRGKRVKADEDGDEIGLWQIEKRVSFVVEERNNSAVSGSGSESTSREMEIGSDKSEKEHSHEGYKSATVVSLGDVGTRRF